jgi:hypothetical protein
MEGVQSFSFKLMLSLGQSRVGLATKEFDPEAPIGNSYKSWAINMITGDIGHSTEWRKYLKNPMNEGDLVTVELD